MRGLFLQDQLEFKLEVAGDGWRQGDELSCALSVKNRGDAPAALGGLQLRTAYGNLKKIRQKTGGAFAPVSSADLNPPSAIGPRQELAFSWTFTIDKNCSITDKTQSLHLLYGNTDDLDKLGQLPVNVQPHPHIQVLLQILETAFSFVLKGQRAAKSEFEAKLKPPAAKKYTMLDQLVLSARFEGEALCLTYAFHVKKLSATPSSFGFKKGVSEVEQRLDSSGYLFPGGYVNHDPLEKAIAEALASVESGI